jgi:predicted nuclease of predicted toxin-antitoxin system
VPEEVTVPLDQNVPRAVKQWFLEVRPAWSVYHTSDVELDHRTDEELYDWAQEHRAIIITFDEDFADQRSFAKGEHAGIIRLKVWPTSTQEVQKALTRLFAEVEDKLRHGALAIVDSNKIRVRFRKAS